MQNVRDPGEDVTGPPGGGRCLPPDLPASCSAISFLSVLLLSPLFLPLPPSSPCLPLPSSSPCLPGGTPRCVFVKDGAFGRRCGTSEFGSVAMQCSAAAIERWDLNEWLTKTRPCFAHSCRTCPPRQRQTGQEST